VNEAIAFAVGLLFGLAAAFFLWLQRGAAAQRLADAESARATSEARLQAIPHLEQQLLQAQSDLQASREKENDLQNELRKESNRAASVTAELKASREKVEELYKQSAAQIEAIQQEAKRERDERLAGKEVELRARDKYIESIEEKIKEVLGKAAADAVLEAHNHFLKVTAQTSEMDLEKRQDAITRLITPLQKQLHELQKLQADFQKDRIGEAATIRESIESLGKQTTTLENILRKPQVRGTWGEQQLEALLDNAGMRKGQDFDVQQSTTAGERRVRADFVINLPQGRKLVIDCKTPFDAYVEAMNARDESKRFEALDRHVTAVRGHIKELSSKEYQDRHPGADCVILFMPHEGAYIHALEREPKLIDEGREKRVYIASPSSILGIIHMARYILQEERQRGNAEAMVEHCNDLIGRIRILAGHLTSLGKSLTSSVNHYNNAVASVDNRLMVTARNLQKLNAGNQSDIQSPATVDALPGGIRSPELQLALEGESHS